MCRKAHKNVVTFLQESGVLNFEQFVGQFLSTKVKNPELFRVLNLTHTSLTNKWLCQQILHNAWDILLLCVAIWVIRVQNKLSSPRGAWAFDELRRYHNRPLQLNWGPENVHFGKMHFRDPNINARIFIFLENLKNYQAQLFYVLRFPLRYLKMAHKTVQSSKNAEK